MWFPDHRSRRALIRRWIPQGLRDIYNTASGRAIRFKGIYSRWEDAEQATQGYAEDSLFRTIEGAALAVKQGKAAWEQDGVAHDDIPPDWPILACLSQVALVNDGTLTVLDYGGALGSSYHQARPYLIGVKNLRWHIVEQPHLVASGRAHFETDQLKFHDSLANCLTESEPNVVFLSAVLQYLSEPFDLLEHLMATPVQFVIVDRHPETMTTGLLTVQKVPSSLYAASYPCWLFDPHKLDDTLSRSFERLCRWPGKDPPICGRGGGHRIGATYVGGFWRRRASP